MNIKFKNEKDWIFGSFDISKVREIEETLGLPSFLAKLLVIRGFDDVDSAKDFMSSDILSFPDPYLLPDMDKAVSRIKNAIENKERILIYGDYDVDGISSVAALYLYLCEKGADVCYYIPERLCEGYGLNNEATDKFAKGGISLIITVDTGITAISETEYIRSKGMDIIITDHHECREQLPQNACAVINPKRPDSNYPFKELAGVGVVFKLICALEEKENHNEIYEKYLDIVSLGTVADVMPVYGENRRIVHHGLSVLNSGANVGISSLLACAIPEPQGAAKKITSSTIGFAIAPRLNAAGRIGDVKRAAELLITSNKEKADFIAEELCALNRERQSIENKILSEATEKIQAEVDFERDKIIILASDGWHQGVIGIVASRLTEKYGLPSILISFDGESGKGSARSIPGFNINTALLYCKDTLIKSGGHELAAGLSVEKQNFSEFKEMLSEYARDNITDEMSVQKLSVDCELEAQEIDLVHAEMLGLLEPYGNGNPAPVFAVKNAVIKEIIPIGMNKHLKLILEKDGLQFTALYFNKTPEDFRFIKGGSVDVAFNLEINEFRGQKNAQMNVRDMKYSSLTVEYINKQAKEYLRAVATFVTSCANIPDMQSFRAAFIEIRSALKNSCEIDIFDMSSRISEKFSMPVSHCMLNIMLDVFVEMGLVEIERYTLNEAKLSLISVDGKVNLEKSALLAKLKENCLKTL